ncbi:MAG: ABC transporter permease [Actinomycetota bacterium]|nr:ABC transporter permease [Actinomycetota bacterium]
MSMSAVVLEPGRLAPPSQRRSRAPAVAGGLFVGAFALLSMFGSRVAPYRATALSGPSLQAPGPAHLLGTNLLGQDVLSQLVLGTRASVEVALLAGLGTVLLGGTIGITAGWFGGLLDAALMRFTDLVLVVPKFPLLLLAGALTGGSVAALSLLIAATFWPVAARVLRSQVLSLRTRTHVRAATGFGAGSWHQLRVHILPDLALLAVAELIGAAARAVVLQAGLAFLGIGSVTQASWGAMTRDAVNYKGLFVTSVWKWWLVPPVAAVVVLVTGIALLGTAAERRLSPRLGRHHR